MSSTGIKENCFDYALFYNNFTCLSDINCSGLSIYNSLINASATSTTIINNLNSLSTNSTLSINNLNATSTTILGLVNGHTTSISNINATSTTIFNNLNSLSTNSGLITPNNISVTGVNPTYSLGGGSLIGYCNTTPSTLSLAAIIGDSVFRAANGNKLILQSGAAGAALFIDQYNNVVLDNATTCLSSLNISGNATFTNPITSLSSLNISGITTINNQLTCTSSLNVSGTSNIGPLYINNSIGTQNTFFQIGTTGNILTINGSQYTTLGCSEGTGDTQIKLCSGAGAYYMVNYNTSGTTQHVFGDTTGNTYLKLNPDYNHSNNPFIIVGNTTINSNLNVLGNINVPNIPTQKQFCINVTGTSYLTFFSSYYKYDIDLRLYTTVNNPTPYTQTRKFKFMAALWTGAHAAGNFSLSYDVDYSLVNYTGLGSLALHNGLNVAAIGSPTSYNLNQFFPSVCLIQNTFDYVSVYSKKQIALHCIILDYLK